jgi:hypothetical protein
MRRVNVKKSDILETWISDQEHALIVDNHGNLLVVYRHQTGQWRLCCDDATIDDDICMNDMLIVDPSDTLEEWEHPVSGGKKHRFVVRDDGSMDIEYLDTSSGKWLRCYCEGTGADRVAAALTADIVIVEKP